MYSPMVAVQTVLPETPVIIDALTMLAKFRIWRAFVDFSQFLGLIYRETLSQQARWSGVCGPTP